MSLPKLQTKAKAFGTFVSPTTGTILYVDPKHDDEKHHSPVLDKAEAAEAFMRGYIEDPADAKEVKLTTAYEEVRDPNVLASVATERTAEHAPADADVSPQPSTLDSRASTAWKDNDRVAGAAEGFTDGVRSDDNDVDAPPVAGRAKPGPKPGAKARAGSTTGTGDPG